MAKNNITVQLETKWWLFPSLRALAVLGAPLGQKRAIAAAEWFIKRGIRTRFVNG